MKEMKYLVCPGRIIPESDFSRWIKEFKKNPKVCPRYPDEHYISAIKLINLYGVNPSECVVYKPEYEGHPCIRGLIKLESCNGDYRKRLKELTYGGVK